MKKGLVIGLILGLIILVVLVFVFMGNQKANTVPSSNENQENNIAINNFAFSPPTITIKKGETIVWKNEDSIVHTVTSDSGNEIESDNLANGQTYSHTFNSEGTFSYHCNIHKMMKGTVIVE